MKKFSRRHFISAAAASLPLAAKTVQADSNKTTLIIGVSTSPRKGKTTSRSVEEALKAAKAVDKRVETELIDLGGLEISGWQGGAKPNDPVEIIDDFNLLLPSFQAPNLGGIIIGSPSYFRSMSALCKSFLERLAVLRSPKLLLADKAVGALSVGGYRNGGQELVIEQILAAMLCHEVLVVGGKPKAHQGATLWNAYNDNIMKDEFGIQSAKNLGIRVAEVALKNMAGLK